MKDYKVKIRVYNGRLYSAIETAGYISMRRFAIAAGVGYSKVNSLLNMKDAVVTQKGELSPSVVKICVFLNKEPSQLFNDVQMYDGLRINTAEMYLDEADVTSLMSPSFDPIALLEEKDIVKSMDTVLETLSEIEQRVMRQRFGLDGEEKTFEEIGKLENLTKERIRQIEQKALRKLRHPDRRDLFEGTDAPPKPSWWDKPSWWKVAPPKHSLYKDDPELGLNKYAISRIFSGVMGWDEALWLLKLKKPSRTDWVRSSVVQFYETGNNSLNFKETTYNPAKLLRNAIPKYPNDSTIIKLNELFEENIALTPWKEEWKKYNLQPSYQGEKVSNSSP